MSSGATDHEVGALPVVDGTFTRIKTEQQETSSEHQSGPGKKTQVDSKKPSERQLARRRIVSGINNSRQKLYFSELSDDEETETEESDEEWLMNKKRKSSLRGPRGEFQQPERKKVRKSSTGHANDSNRDELRKTRKSLLLQKDEIKSKKAKQSMEHKDDGISGKGKIKRKSSRFAAGEKSIENSKDVLKAFPEAKVIKKRIEGAIKRDAGRELLRWCAQNGGQVGNGDIEKIVRIYNAFGYKFITSDAVSQHANLLVGTTTYKSILTRYGIEAIHFSAMDQIGSEQPSNETAQTVNTTTLKDNVETLSLPEVPHTRDENIDPTSASSLTKEAEDAIDVNLPKTRRVGGRPKGSTKDKIALLPKKVKRPPKSKLVLELTQRACEIFFAEREKAQSQNDKVANGTLSRIIGDIEKEYSLPAGSINMSTVLSRYKAKNPTGRVHQRTPILEGIEPEIIDYCVQLANLGQPLLKEQLILVANQLVTRYNLEDEIVEFKKKRGLMNEDELSGQKKLIGIAWFQGFCERHMNNIQEKFGREFAHAGRHFHLRVEHFKSMYDLVYESMVKAGIAEKYAKPTLFDIEGGRVAHKEREWAYGLPSRYKMTKPDFVLYVDQCGSKVKANRQLNFYGHVDGQMFSLPVDCSGTGMGLAEGETEMKFCVYSFINGLGESVLCAVILKSDRDILDIPLSVRWGIDTLKALNGGRTELELFENNCGVGQAMQGGPVCNYKGKEVNCFVGTSVDGKLNCQILLDICKYLDEIELYDRSNGMQPFLLLDGHCTNFDVDFLDYVKDESHQWMVSCGLPRDTHLLHVADSDEFNSSFKDEFANVKQRFLDTRMHDRKHFYPSDIIPLVHHTWSLCYSHAEGAKRAIALRGWNPLNYALLLHPMLNKRGQQLSEVTKQKTPEKKQLWC